MSSKSRSNYQAFCAVECFLSSGAWRQAADMGSDLGRVLSHTFGWVVRTQDVDELADSDIAREGRHLMRESEE